MQNNDKQCLCTLQANPDTIVRLEAARRIYDAHSDKVRRPDSIADKDRLSLRQDIESELAEGKRTGEFWTKGGWDEQLDKAADHGFSVLSQVLIAEEKAGNLNWIEQFDGVVKILRHISGVLVYHSIASSPKLSSKRRKIGDVDDMAAWVAVALEERDLTAESATLVEDMARLLSFSSSRWLGSLTFAFFLTRRPTSFTKRRKASGRSRATRKRSRFIVLRTLSCSASASSRSLLGPKMSPTGPIGQSSVLARLLQLNSD